MGSVINIIVISFSVHAKLVFPFYLFLFCGSGLTYSGEFSLCCFHPVANITPSRFYFFLSLFRNFPNILERIGSTAFYLDLTSSAFVACCMSVTFVGRLKRCTVLSQSSH